MLSPSPLRIAALAILILPLTACDRQTAAPGEAPTEESQVEWEIPFPTNDGSCDEERVQVWAEAITPWIEEVPRQNLRQSEPMDSSDMGPVTKVPATGPMRDPAGLPEGDMRIFHLLDLSALKRDDLDMDEDRLRFEIETDMKDIFRLDLPGAGLRRPDAEPIRVGLVLSEELTIDFVVATLKALYDKQYREVTFFLEGEEPAFPEGVEPVPTLTKELSHAGFREAGAGCAAVEDLFLYMRGNNHVREVQDFLNQLGPAWSSLRCRCAPDIEFLIAAVLEQRLPKPYTYLTITLSNDGTPVELSSDETWQTLADRLQEYHGQPVRISLLD